MATADAVSSGRRLVRFDPAERWMHWVHAAAFAAMLVTGIGLYLPSVAGVIGSRQDVKAVHLFSAAVWLVALLVVAGVGSRARLAATVRDFDRFDLDDRRWLRGGRTPQGRFNAGQKVHAIVQAAAAVLFLLSGMLLWLGERNTALRLDGTIVLHDALTVGTTALVLGHLYLALVHRPTRPALAGMVRGSVDGEWAGRHHPKWTGQDPDLQASNRRAATWALLAVAVGVAVAAVLVIPSS